MLISTLRAVDDRMPLAQNTMIFADLSGQIAAILAARSPTGQFVEPSMCPCENSPGDRTSSRTESSGSVCVTFDPEIALRIASKIPIFLSRLATQRLWNPSAIDCTRRGACKAILIYKIIYYSIVVRLAIVKRFCLGYARCEQPSAQEG